MKTRITGFNLNEKEEADRDKARFNPNSFISFLPSFSLLPFSLVYLLCVLSLLSPQQLCLLIPFFFPPSPTFHYRHIITGSYFSEVEQQSNPLTTI